MQETYYVFYGVSSFTFFSVCKSSTKLAVILLLLAIILWRLVSMRAPSLFQLLPMLRKEALFADLHEVVSEILKTTKYLY